MMKPVKARCLKCQREIEADADEDAGVCPFCGAAYVTEKAIKNYNPDAEKASGGEFEALSELSKKYFAFVSLYKDDYTALTDLYRLRAKIRAMEDEVNSAIDKHNDLIVDEETWRDRYNSRAQGFNDTGYTVASNSISKNVHKKYVESAKKKHDAVAEDIKSARSAIYQQKSELEKLRNEEKELSDKAHAANFEYSVKAHKITQIMRERYPANPLGYLYAADWYAREAKRSEEFFGYFEKCGYTAADRETEMAEKDLNLDKLRQRAADEKGKADKLMTKEFGEEYAALTKPLLKVSDTVKTAAKSKRTETVKPAPATAKTAKTTKTAKIKASSNLNWLPALLCCIPLICELTAVFVIPHISALASIKYVANFGWNALSVPMRVAFFCVIGAGLLVQLLGLFDKLSCVKGMITQIITFALFLLSVCAAADNAESVYTQWGLAAIAPASLIIAALRYMTEDKFGFVDDFGFKHYLVIAIEVAEYAGFCLVFTLLFDVPVTLWIFIAITVTTVAAIALSAFWEDMRWIAAGVNLLVAALLCLVYWFGRLWNSEWLWSGGIIIVVILAIGGSIFAHWFMHRNDL